MLHYIKHQVRIRSVEHMKKRRIYRVLSIVFGVLMTVLTFLLIMVNHNSSGSDVFNVLLFGFTCVALTLSLFSILIVFVLTENMKDD